MRVSKIVRYICLLLIIPSILHAVGPPICTLDANGRVTNVDAGGSSDFCRLSAQEFTINLKYAGLCTSQPNETNFRSVCSAVFDNTAGQDITVTENASLPLVDEITLPEGIFTHAWLLVGNTVKYKASASFDPVRTGKTGTGQFCWTLPGNTSPGIGSINDASARTSWLADCGSAVPTELGTSYSTIIMLTDFSTGNFVNYSSGTNASGTWLVRLLDADGTASDIQPNGSFTRLATQMGGVQTFTTPVDLTPNATNVDIGFRLENTFGVLLGDVGGTDTYVPRFGVGGFEFKFVAN